MKLIPALNQQTRKCLEFTGLQYMLDAAYENPAISKVYVDDEFKPGLCILLIKRMVFVGGVFSSESFVYLMNEILNFDLRNHMNVFYIFCGSDEWENAIKTHLPDRCFKFERSLYHIKPDCQEDYPANEYIKEINPELMNSGIANCNMISNEVLETATYKDMEDFFIRGIGYTPVIDNKVCGFCTSEYPSASSLAIGIEVSDEYQGRGMAKAMTKAFLSKASKRGLNVYWECWKNNVPSVKTALSCGFYKAADYPVLLVDFGKQ